MGPYCYIHRSACYTIKEMKRSSILQFNGHATQDHMVIRAQIDRIDDRLDILVKDLNHFGRNSTPGYFLNSLRSKRSAPCKTALANRKGIKNKALLTLDQVDYDRLFKARKALLAECMHPFVFELKIRY